jgi:hypothetical protein
VIEWLGREEQRRKVGQRQGGEIAGDKRVDEHAEEIRMAPIGDGKKANKTTPTTR